MILQSLQTCTFPSLTSSRSRISRGKVAFIKGSDHAKSPKSKSFFLTENEYYDVGKINQVYPKLEGNYHYMPIQRNPALNPIIERNKSLTKEQRIKKSKLLSQFLGSSGSQDSQET